MANRYHAPYQVHKQPITRISKEDRARVNSFAEEMNITQFEALKIILQAGFDAIENNGVDPKRVQRMLVA